MHRNDVKILSPVLWWLPKKTPQNLLIQKFIHFSETRKRNRNTQFVTPENGPSLHIYENIRIPSLVLHPYLLGRVGINSFVLCTSVVCSKPLQTGWTQIRPGWIWIQSVGHSSGNPERFFSKKLILKENQQTTKKLEFPRGGKELKCTNKTSLKKYCLLSPNWLAHSQKTSHVVNTMTYQTINHWI